MLDTLTESFCERCGTRYEFAAPEKLTTTRKARGVISGLKNYIMSQDSLSDSVNDAIRSQAEVLASKQLDAFHNSFSFCIDCRQYTCTNCWNDQAGRCQSCQPLPLTEPLGAFQPATNGDSLAATAWPASDLTVPPARTRFGAYEPLQLVGEPEPVEAEAEAEPEAVEQPQPFFFEAEAEPVIMEPEPGPVIEGEAEPVVAEPEPVVEAEPEPVAEIPAQPEPTPIRPLRPIHDTFVRIPRAAPAPADPATVAADNESLAARRAQLEMLGLGDPGEGPVGPERKVLPYRSSGAASPVARLAGGAFWDASAREVAGASSNVGVRSCAECELSLSATARFCRRCGHPQAQSA
jgi:hypothetical protein